jgi:hypothetical protein
MRKKAKSSNRSRTKGSRSDRVSHFADEPWNDEGHQTTHIVKLKDEEVGVGWTDVNGNIRLQLNRCISLSWKDGPIEVLPDRPEMESVATRACRVDEYNDLR